MATVKDKLKKKSIVRYCYYRIIRLIKSNKIVGRSGNTLEIKSLLLNSKVIFRGENNLISIGESSRVENYNIKIFGDNNKIIIADNCFLHGGEFWIEDDMNEIIIGSHTTVEAKTHLACIEGTKIEIGKDCMFSGEIIVRTGDSHSITDMEGHRINKSQNVVIHDHCWIGRRAMIMKGTAMACNTIVGAGAIVGKHFEEENTILAGIPAHIIKSNIGWLRERIKV